MSESANERTGRAALRSLGALLLIGALLLTTSVLAQQPEQSYDLSWYTIDGGGQTWSSGEAGPPGRLYTLGGTIGQPDAGSLGGGDGPQRSEGSHSLYGLGGGFWPGGALAEVLYEIYLPLTWK